MPWDSYDRPRHEDLPGWETLSESDKQWANEGQLGREVGMSIVNFVYEADSLGWISNTTLNGLKTGIRLPRFANRTGISTVELLDEIDIVYKPLSDGTPRRDLIGNKHRENNTREVWNG